MIKRKISWPDENLRSLLKACIIEDADSARKIWRKWLSQGSIDDATWSEFRLLAYLAARIKKIDPDAEEIPRLEGVRRFVWVKNQIRLDRCIQVIDMLQQAGISLMLLKGMARIAANPALISARFVRDIDILVHSSELYKACDILIENGWRPVCGTLPGKIRAEAFSRIQPVNDRFNIDNNTFHVDIHRSVIHYGSTGTFDDDFWDRCNEGNIRGRTVRIPSDTDQFLIAILHATVFDTDRPVDWVIDAMDASKNIDWELFAREIDKRRLGAAVASMFEYLEFDLGLTVPPVVKKIIKRDSKNILFNQEVYAYWRLPENRVWYGDVFQILAEWVRSRHCRYRPARIRQTLWKGRKVSGTQKTDDRYAWSGMTEPVAEYELVPSVETRDNKLSIVLEISDANEPDIQFDLLYGGIWFGRLQLELKQPYSRKTIACFHDLSLPEDLIRQKRNAVLHFIHINSTGMVPTILPFRLCIGLYANNGLKFHRRKTPFTEAYSTLLSGN